MLIKRRRCTYLRNPSVFKAVLPHFRRQMLPNLVSVGTPGSLATLAPGVTKNLHDQR